jgi:DNA repair exonuclease SbcCD ATPase subunit
MAMTDSSRQNDDQQSPKVTTAGAALLAFEAAHGSGVDRPSRRSKTKEPERSQLWRIFGGTLLSIAALVTITLTQQFAGILTEVRQDINRMHEAVGELVRKEELSAALKDAQATASSLSALRERTSFLEQRLREAEDDRKSLTRDLHELRERLAEMAGRQSAAAEAKGTLNIRR